MGSLFKVSGFLYFDEEHKNPAHLFYDYLQRFSKHCYWSMRKVEDNPKFENGKTDLKEFDNEFDPITINTKSDPDFGEVIVGAKYKHFKGHKVQVLAVAQDSEQPGKYHVIYKHIESGRVWSRPYEMFTSIVDKKKYPEVTAKYRFTLLEDKDE